MIVTITYVIGMVAPATDLDANATTYFATPMKCAIHISNIPRLAPAKKEHINRM